MKPNALAFLIVSLFFQACASSDTVKSDEVSQDVIYQYYSVTYDQENAELQIYVQFRVGGATGTTLQLVEPSRVSYSEFALSEKQTSIGGTSYQANKESSFIEEHEFEYRNNDGEVFSNSLELIPVDFEDFSVNISQNEDLQIEWTGDPLDEDESIQLEIRDSEGFLVIASSHSAGAESVTMHKEDLQLLQTGIIRLKLVRTTTFDLQEATPKGGRMIATYKSRAYSANLLSSND